MGETIELKTRSGERFSGYLARPASGTGPGVVVLQEIFGVNANMRTVCDRLADEGYAALAPDLFWRAAPGIELDAATEAGREQAMGLMKGLDQGGAVEDALIAAEALAALPGATGKIGMVGYCLGGRLAFLTSMRPGIVAAVSYYGMIDSLLDRAGDIQCPVLLHIAEKDHLCPPEAQVAIHAALAQGPVEILDYPGVGHAFARHGSPMRDDASADRADAATLAFLARHLQG